MSRRLWPVAAAAALALAAGACGTPGGAPTPTPFVITPCAELVAQGRTLYAQSCATCHGNERGEGRYAGAPPHTGEGHTWHHADRQLVEWVLDGPPLRTAMPAFRGQLSEEEVVAVLAYIKTLWTEEQRQRQAEMSRLYDQQVRRLTPGP